MCHMLYNTGSYNIIYIHHNDIPEVSFVSQLNATGLAALGHFPPPDQLVGSFEQFAELYRMVKR